MESAGRALPVVAVLLYPGCLFFEIALAAEVLAEAGATLRYLTPDGQPHAASNGARIAADGAFDGLIGTPVDAVLVPGGDPRAVIAPSCLAEAPLRAAQSQGALLAGICAGNLVLAASGLLRGRRGTHNYTAEHASPEQIAATAPYWDGLQFERADVVVDAAPTGTVITAQFWAYRAYAVAVGRALGRLDEAEATRILRQPLRAYAPLGT